MPDQENREASRSTNPIHGQLCYLQIPAVDAMKSAEFYERVFGWRIERPHASFDAPGLIGQWVTDRPVSPSAGALLWINVDDIDAAAERVRAAGGQILTPIAMDGPRRLATILDPAGNAIGIAQH